MLQPVPLGGFAGGLNLADAAELVDATQAIDCLDVDYTSRGAIRGRDGYAPFGSYALPAAADNLGAFESANGQTRQLVVSTPAGLRVLDNAGARIAAGDLARTASPHWFARLGGVAGDALLAANGVDPLARWSGAAWSTSGYSGLAPNGRFVAVSPGSARVVMARFTGAADDTSPSTVRWSDPDNPSSWPASNYVLLNPGDGEDLMGIAVWRELTFVFKRSRFFVFGKERAGAGGKPAFDFQPVDTGRGLAVEGGLAVSAQGVFFVSRDGVYLTTGGPPVPVSGAIDPLFTGKLGPFYNGVAINQAAMGQVRMATYRNKVALAVPTEGSACDRILVLDERGAWTVYAIATNGLCMLRVSEEPEFVFAQGAAVMRHSRNYTTDNGKAIASHWLGGFDNLGVERVKVLRELEVWGEGRSVAVGVCIDYESFMRASARFDFGAVVTDNWGGGAGPDTWGGGAGADTWGGRSAPAEKRMRQSTEGVVFAVRIEASESPWTIYRCTRHTRIPRPVESFTQ